jgi:Family of unknown function (DUF5939)
MSEAGNLFTLLRQSADPEAAGAIEELVEDAPDRALCRINVIDFARQAGVDEERAVTARDQRSQTGVAASCIARHRRRRRSLRDPLIQLARRTARCWPGG